MNDYRQKSNYNIPVISCDYYIKRSIQVSYVTKEEWDSMSKEEQKHLVDKHKLGVS